MAGGSLPPPKYNKASGAGAGASTGTSSGASADDMALNTMVASMLGISYDVVGDPTGVNINVFDSKVTPPTFAGPTGLANPKKMSIGKAMGFITQLPEDELISWKNELYDAGLYSPSMYTNGMKPRQIGVITDEDRSAFQSLFYTAIAAPGPNVTAQEIIMKLKKDNPYSKEKGYGAGNQKVTAQVSDPATIRNYARVAAQELLGRKLDDVTMNQLITKMSQQETGGALAGATAQQQSTGGVILNENVDVAARTAQAIEAENPAEVTAKRVTDGFDVFMKMINGG